MVCPYRLVTTAFTAVLSILMINRATAAPLVAGSAQLARDGTPTKPAPAQTRRWTPATVLLLVALVLLHVDLLVTGHLRAGVKGLIAQLRASN